VAWGWDFEVYPPGNPNTSPLQFSGRGSDEAIRKMTPEESSSPAGEAKIRKYSALRVQVTDEGKQYETLTKRITAIGDQIVEIDSELAKLNKR
jgi:hypothetical protein